MPPYIEDVSSGGIDLSCRSTMPPAASPNRFLLALLLGYGLIWIATALTPRDRPTWLLENVPVVVVVATLVVTWRRFAFSNLAYLLIAAFLALHAVGAHTGYAHSPWGDWLKNAFDLRRNYYDRIVHCAFGLLLAFPIRELLLARAGLPRRAAGWYAVILVTAASTLFEVAEAFLCETLSPGTGPDWLGAQGDEWDAQLDMLVALLGAIAATLMTSWRERASPTPSPYCARA